MGKDSAIGWTHHTFNIVWGCQKVSEECDHCYAEVFAKRLGLKVWGPPKTTERRVLSDKYWKDPILWDHMARDLGQRHRVFCSSMADVFEDHPTVESQRARLWPLIEQTPNLDWLLLTKRPQNVMRMVPSSWHTVFPPNVWQGITAGLPKRLDERWPHLRDIPARVRFISFEPLLDKFEQLPLDMLKRLHWAIVGGETGPDGIRTELDLDAAEGLVRGLSVAMEAAVFVKQDSGRVPGQRGRLPDWMWNLKQFPAVAA